MTLQVEAITCGYRTDVAVVHDFSVDVTPGKAVGVVGRNGAGKTCIAGSLIGVRSLHSGRITLNGTRLDGRNVRARIDHGLALVPEGRMIFGQLTVHENLVAAAYGAGSTLDQTLLAHINETFPILGEKSSAAAASLSGGEQQWLAIARALVQRPQAIILDEPTLGLSPVAVAALGETLVSIRETGVALLLMEQNPDLLKSLCTDVHVLDRGRIISSLTISSATDDEEFAKVLLGAI